MPRSRFRESRESSRPVDDLPGTLLAGVVDTVASNSARSAPLANDRERLTAPRQSLSWIHGQPSWKPGGVSSDHTVRDQSDQRERFCDHEPGEHETELALLKRCADEKHRTSQPKPQA